MKSGIENLSGHSLDDVKVHYNSDKPAQLQAHAYAQGTDIHVAPGQEKHVVQQKQGRVKPTRQMKGKVNVNDDKGLEKEADIMGQKALDVKKEKTINNVSKSVQRKEKEEAPLDPLVTQRAPITKEPPVLKSMLLPCGHESTCVLQRMITVEPPDTTDLEVLEKYVFGIPVNNRNQTFEHAVKGNANGEMWFERLEILLNNKEVNAALLDIRRIIRLINTTEAKEPDHPNQVWRGVKAEDNAKSYEAPYSISKTGASIAMANDARNIILSAGILKEGKFMLGVLVLPDGKVIVALSGSRADLLGPLGDLLKKPLPLFDDQVYDIRSIAYDDKITYRSDAEHEAATLEHFGEEQGKIVRKRGQDKEDLGSYPATCAAAVALSVAKSVSPKSFASGGKMGLTEVFVSTNKRSEVMIYNKHTSDGERFTMDSPDVPSCHVCQMQLGHVATEVVALERNGILVHLEMSMDEKKQEMVLMQKELESLLMKQKKMDVIASAKEELEALLQEGNKRQNEIKVQLQETQVLLKRCTDQLQDMTLRMGDLDKRIKELDALNEDRKWQITKKRQAAAYVFQLEKEIKTLEQKVAKLTKDETDLSQAASTWNAPFYTTWHEKIKELQSRKEFAGVEKDKMDTSLATHLKAEKGNLAEMKLGIQDESSSAELKEKAVALELTRKEGNVEKTEKEKALRLLKPEAEKLSTEHQQLNKSTSELEAELETSLASTKDLKIRVDESSETANALRNTKRLVKNLEVAISKKEREMIRLDMTRSVYK